MSRDNNETLIRRWFNEIWNERRSDAIYELLAADGISHLEGTELVGPHQFHQYHSELIAIFPDLRVTVEEVISQGEAVAARWSMEATHEGEGLGLVPTGQKVTTRGMTWVHIRDGKIVEGWDSWNQGGLMQRLRGALSGDE